MSYADHVFKSIANDILKYGTSNKGEKVRTVWADTNEPAYTKKLFGYAAKYNLQKEFPALTLRKTAIKSAMDEILWIYQKNSNNVHDLNSHIWDQWADEKGSIGKAYGYQVGKKFRVLKNVPINKMDFDIRMCRDAEIREVKPKLFKHRVVDLYMNQMDYVLYMLKNEPFSRRIMISLWSPEDLSDMALAPCCWNIIFNVTLNDNNEKVLNMQLTQRSSDFLAANNWNVVQYALLLMMVAQCVDMIPGQLLHIMTDVHIYDRHEEAVKTLLEREMYPAPKVTLNPDIKNFYDFTTKDIIVNNYQYGEQIKNIPIAK